MSREFNVILTSYRFFYGATHSTVRDAVSWGPGSFFGLNRGMNGNPDVYLLTRHAELIKDAH